MAVFKCKMCGGDLNVEEGTSVIECEYCGTTQTVAAVDSEKKVNLFNRANRLRMNSEFDKAGAIYEQIIAEFPEEAEAYWCLCLCNYGIEYVDDPATGKKIPTCHRASFEKLRKDENYNLALEYADAIAAEVYREQAKEIDRIMGEILSISANEKPYDIFICYKETDAKGERTVDSVLAQDIYDALTDKGYKVFFSRITLEDKLGKLYEPYIFAALNSAKVMLAIGTDYEYYNAVWVRNEWSRFMKLAAADKSKTLIPCFKDIDAYDMPDEFKGLQAQDMGKIGFMQDLCRGIDKLFGREKTAKSAASASPAAATTDSLLKRAFMFLEDGKWSKADDFCEQVLNIDPENAQAYMAKGMAELQVAHRGDIAKKMASLFNESKGMINDVPTVTLRSYSEEITAIIAIGRITGMRDRRQVTEFVHGDLPKTAAINCSPEVLNEVLESISAKGSVDIVVNEPSEQSFSQEDMPEAFKKAIRFGDESLKAELNGYIKSINERNENERKTGIYNDAVNAMKKANSENEYKSAAGQFKSVSGFKDADTLAKQCLDKAEISRKDAIYDSAKAQMTGEKAASYEEAIGFFKTIPGWKDADEQIKVCEKKIEEIKPKEEAERLEAERKAEERRIAEEKAAKKRKKVIAITTPIVCACIAFVIVLTTVIIPKQKLNQAMSLLDSGDYDSAYALLEEIGKSDAIASSKYDRAIALIDSGDYDSAYALLEEIGKSDAIASSKYDRAIALVDSGDYDSAYALLEEIGKSDAFASIKYDRAIAHIDSGDYESAYMLLNGLEYKDSDEKVNEILAEHPNYKIKFAAIGEIVTFGAYEQDNNTSNGKEDIEWQVLAKEDNKVLVISKYALDCQQYNTLDTDVTWESCSLRKWMNGTFLNNAFSAEEQAQIQNTTVSADKNPEYSTNPGNATTDKVFLLSINEAEKYFTNDEARECAPTAYAEAQGTHTSSYKTASGEATCWWWLRSPGRDQNRVAIVSFDGSVFYLGDNVANVFNSVRPAMWISLE